MFYETIIIGAGAAGLFCGAALQNYTHPFLILDHSNKPGLKLLASGAGQCNFTHSGDIKDFIHYYGDNGKKIRSILFRFNNQKTQEFFHQLGLKTKTRDDGKVFPASLQAEDLRQTLLKEIQKNNGEIRYPIHVTSISYDKNQYQICAWNQDNKKITLSCTNLVIATGGKSYPKTGSDGKFLSILQEFDHFETIPQRAALVPIYIEGFAYESLSGISIKQAKIKKGKTEAYGDILFTHKNLSGPLILNFSRYLDPGDSFEIDFLPNGFKSGEHLCVEKEKRTILNYLLEETNLPKAMLEVFLNELQIDVKAKAASIRIKPIEQALRAHTYIVNGKAGLDKAMVTAGGISLNEISTKTLESKNHPGLHFIGEVLDVDGDTGGYNIQFAFSSAYTVAQHILKKP